MANEDLVDAGQIVENILAQPLSIPGADGEISLLSAARNFVDTETESSDLRKILLSFLQFPEQTDVMLRELEIIGEEL